jgi:CBS domain-containing protein
VDFEKALKNEKIRNLKNRRPVTVTKDSSYGEVVRLLCEAKTGCAVILAGKKVIGIFTEQDVLKRGVIPKTDPETPIEKLMTPHPKLLDIEDSVAVAIRLMHDGKYRHLPIVNAKDEFLGLVSVKDIVFYLSENYPYEVYNLPPDPRQISAAPEGA